MCISFVRSFMIIFPQEIVSSGIWHSFNRTQFRIDKEGTSHTKPSLHSYRKRGIPLPKITLDFTWWSLFLSHTKKWAIFSCIYIRDYAYFTSRIVPSPLHFFLSARLQSSDKEQVFLFIFIGAASFVPVFGTLSSYFLWDLFEAGPCILGFGNQTYRKFGQWYVSVIKHITEVIYISVAGFLCRYLHMFQKVSSSFSGCLSRESGGRGSTAQGVQPPSFLCIFTDILFKFKPQPNERATHVSFSHWAILSLERPYTSVRSMDASRILSNIGEQFMFVHSSPILIRY